LRPPQLRADFDRFESRFAPAFALRCSDNPRPTCRSSYLDLPALEFSQIIAKGNDTPSVIMAQKRRRGISSFMNRLIDNPWSRQTVKTYRGYLARQHLEKTREEDPQTRCRRIQEP
jgi:hypothetical protein